MDAKEYSNVKPRLAGGTSSHTGSNVSRQTRRRQAANLARAHKKQARKNWFKKTV